jgi:Na+/H+-dicarboxylate symporter
LTATAKPGLYGTKLFLRKIFGLMSLQHRTKVLRKFYIEITFYISLLLPFLYNFKINIFDFILFDSRQYFYLFISHSSQIVKWRRLYSFRHFSLTINKLKI